MKLLNLTLPTPAENLALDEALLEAAEDGNRPAELLRLWESPVPIVVVGRSSRVAREVHMAACREEGVPVLRRCSGGAAIVAGPGCLMYAVVLSYQLRPELRVLDQAHRFVLERMQCALAALAPEVAMAGTSDLTLGDRKFSGNSLRCKREHLLYHGTILYQFPMPLISRCLDTAPRQPEYRHARDHHAFVTNFPATVTQLRSALCRTWSAELPAADWPQGRVATLVATRYAQDRWNLRL